MPSVLLITCRFQLFKINQSLRASWLGNCKLDLIWPMNRIIYPFLLFWIAIKFCSATGMAWIKQIFLLHKQMYRELGLGVALEIFKAQVQVKVPGQVRSQNKYLDLLDYTLKLVWYQLVTPFTTRQLFFGFKWLKTITVWLKIMYHWSWHSRWYSWWHTRCWMELSKN